MTKAAQRTSEKKYAKAGEKPDAGERGRNLGQISDDELNDIAGGMGGEFSSNIDLPRLRVRCPVPGCGFDCGTFADMNIHMRTCHPERC